MNRVADFDALRARYEADRAAEAGGRRAVVEARLTLALEAIGWRGAGGAPAEEVAAEAAYVLEACIREHRDPRRAGRELAALLRASSAMLDGGGASATAFIPAAEELLARYAGPAVTGG